MDRIHRNDSFLVVSKAHLAAIDYQVLSLLYQPLIGPGALTLYLVMFGLLNRQTMISEAYLHSDLESMLSMKVEKLETTRHKLEAIGLLSSYRSGDHFLYELKAPLSPYAFVNDGVLGQYLQAALTATKFAKALALFQVAFVRTEAHVAISKAFNDVFEQLPDRPELFDPTLMNGSKASSIKVAGVDFDLRLFCESIPDPFFDSSQFTETVRSKILNLAYVYGLDETDLKDVYLKAIDASLRPDLVKLSMYARDAYQQKNRADKSAAPEEAHTSTKPTDPVEYFKTVSFRTLLEDMGQGRMAAVDLRTVEQLIDDIGLDKGVVNVLVAYVLRIKDGSMPTYDYFEKLGLSWKKDGINTVELAIDYVKHLSSEYARRKDQPKTTRKGKPDLPDVEVPWLDQYLADLKKTS